MRIKSTLSERASEEAPRRDRKLLRASCRNVASILWYCCITSEANTEWSSWENAVCQVSNAKRKIAVFFMTEIFYGLERVGLQSVRREVRDRYPLLMSFERWKE